MKSFNARFGALALLCSLLGCLFAPVLPAQTFTNVTATVGLPQSGSTSVSWADYDNDGRLDLLAGTTIWRNTDSGFTNVTASVAPGLPAGNRGSAWVDYDGDGRPDLFITGYRTSGGYNIMVSELWRNTGNGFTNVTASVAPGLTAGEVTWGDYDNDGRLDFFLTGYFVSQIWRNTGSNFVNVTDAVAPGLTGVSGGIGKSVAWGDYDNDGRLDFILTGGIPRRSDQDDNWPYYTPISQIWRNTGSGFVNVTATVAPGLPGVYWGSVEWGDYDNDGRLDLLITGSDHYYGSISQLWRNTGNGFVNSGAVGLPGVVQGPAAWGDYDNDGRLDILLAGYLFRNAASGFIKATSTDAPDLSRLGGSSLAWGDYNNDGRLDFIITGSKNFCFYDCDEPSPTFFQLWQNNILQSTPPPAVLTKVPSDASQNSVVLNASINPRSQSANAWFIWGNSTNYGQVSAAQPMGNGNAVTNFAQALTGLSAGVTYYYRAVGSNDQGKVVLGVEQRFALLPPGVTTSSNGNFRPNTATIKGQVTPHNLPTYGWFEWGLTPALDQVTPVQFLGNGFDATVSQDLFGLVIGTTFYFRAVVSNNLGVAYGAAQSLVMIDAPFVCPTVSLSPSSKSLNYAGGAGYSVYVVIACPWIVINTNSWITITSATNGAALESSLTFNVATNTNPQPRSGNITVGGRNFLVSQGGNTTTPPGTNVTCTYYISPGHVNHGYGATMGTVYVGAATNCAWEVLNTNSWITILSGASGMGSSNVVYGVEANTGMEVRSGYITIGGRNYAVTQSGRSVSPPADQAVALGSTATFSVTAYITPPLTYQWQFNGVNLVDGDRINGAATATLVLTDVQYSQGGHYRCVVSNLFGTFASSSATLTVAPTNDALPIDEALDTEDTLFWKTWANSPGGWFGQTNTTHDGVDALECSGLAPDAYASLEAKSGGPGMLSFWWKTAFATPSDRLVLSFGSAQAAVVASTTDWEQRTFTVPGDVSLRWTFSNASTGEQSKAWLDQVQFTPCDFTISPISEWVSYFESTRQITLTAASADCPWAVVNSNSWVTIVSSVTNHGSGTVIYSVAPNPSATSRDGYISIADQSFHVYQSYSPSTNAGISLAEALDTTGSLEWSTIGTPEWFGQSTVSRDGSDAAQSGSIGHSSAVTATTSVNGPGTVYFWWKVSSETNKDYLKFFINGVQQTRISGEVDWQLLSYNLFSGSNVLKWTYSKSDKGTVGNDRGWLDQVQFVPTPETGLCAVAISPISATHSGNSETGSVSVIVAAGCGWNVVNTNSWITYIASPGLVRYTVSANNSRNQRTGVLLIGGRPFTVTQPSGLPPCSYYISPNALNIGPAAYTGSFSVSTESGCGWDIINTNPWITIVASPINSSSGYVTYSVPQNTSPNSRLGYVRLGDRTFALCQYGAVITLAEALDTVGTSLTWPNDWYYPWIGEGNVTHDGADAAQSGAMPDNGSSTLQTTVNGPGTFSFWWKVSSETNYDSLRLYLNGVELARISGEVDWQQRNVTLPAGAQIIRWSYSKDESIAGGQDRGWLDQVQFVPAGCGLTLSPGSAVHSASNSSGSVSVTVASGCSWNVFNTNAWISILSGTNGSGNGSVNYAVAANIAPPVRSGSIQIGDKNFLVTQSGYTNPPTNCIISISPTNRAHGYGRATNTVVVITQNGCAWSVVSTNPWISILSSSNSSSSGIVMYSLAANTNALPRSGNIMIGGRNLFLTQSGPPRLQFITRPGTNAMLTVQGSQGTYVVECSEDLIHWIPISTNSAPSTINDVPVGSAPRRFYRTVEIP